MIYLDHAATTNLFPQAKDAMMEWMEPSRTGNPSSVHSRGVAAKKAIETAREQVADLIGAKGPECIVFTSGGTEANNQAIWNCEKKGTVTSPYEHESIAKPVNAFNWFRLDRTTGAVSLPLLEHDIMSLCRKTTMDDGTAVIKSNYHAFLIWVNNELGVVNDIPKIADFLAKHGIGLHVDGVQAVGHIPMDVKHTWIKTMSMSAHKFGGPMGVGALYISDADKLFGKDKYALLQGGGQEHALRSGTENVPGIVGMGVAAKLAKEMLLYAPTRWEAYANKLLSILTNRLHDTYHTNCRTQNSNIVSLTFPGVHAESLVLALDAAGVCVSAGSACSSNGTHDSATLKSIGLSHKDRISTIRISMGYNTTASEVEYTAEIIADRVLRLRDMG